VQEVLEGSLAALVPAVSFSAAQMRLNCGFLLCRSEGASRDVQDELVGGLAALMPAVNPVFFGLVGASVRLVSSYQSKHCSESAQQETVPWQRAAVSNPAFGLAGASVRLVAALVLSGPKPCQSWPALDRVLSPATV